MKNGVHILAKRAMGLAAALGAGTVVYSLLWCRSLRWRSGLLRMVGLFMTAAGLIGRRLVSRGHRRGR